MHKAFVITLVIGVGLGLLGAGWFFLLPSLTQESFVCTTDAKICPDGSAVGRSGPHCEFAPCPNGDAPFDHLGVVTRDTSGTPEQLSLVYEMPGAPALTKQLAFDSASMCSSPEGTQTCAAFNAPLRYAFGGKRVRVVGIDRGASLLVQRIELLGDDTQKPARTTVTVKLGQSATGSDIVITPQEVTDDSRCPTDVQCVWAGTVKVRATLTDGADTKEVVIERGMPLSTKNTFVTLTAVSPAKTTGAVDSTSYRFTFEITAQSEVAPRN